MDAMQRVEYLDKMMKTVQCNNLGVFTLAQYYEEVKTIMKSGLDNALYYLISLANAHVIINGKMDNDIYKLLMRNLKMEIASLINKQLEQEKFSFAEYYSSMKSKLAEGVPFSTFREYCDMFDLAVYARTEEVDLLDWSESLLATKVIPTNPLEIIQLNGYKKKLKQYAVCAHRYLEQAVTNNNDLVNTAKKGKL